MESLSSYYFAISGDHFHEDDIDIDYRKEDQSVDAAVQNSDDPVSEKNDD